MSEVIDFRKINRMERVRINKFERIKSYKIFLLLLSYPISLNEFYVGWLNNISNVSIRSFRKYVKEMRELNLIERTGSGKFGRSIILSNIGDK